MYHASSPDAWPSAWPTVRALGVAAIVCLSGACWSYVYEAPSSSSAVWTPEAVARAEKEMRNVASQAGLTVYDSAGNLRSTKLWFYHLDVDESALLLYADRYHLLWGVDCVFVFYWPHRSTRPTQYLHGIAYAERAVDSDFEIYALKLDSKGGPVCCEWVVKNASDKAKAVADSMARIIENTDRSEWRRLRYPFDKMKS